MEAVEIIQYLRQRDLSVSLADDDSLELSPAEKITEELIQRLLKHKPEIIAELKREERRAKVLAILAENPNTQRAIHHDTETDPDNVILTIAIRDRHTFEMTIPKAKYDPFTVLEIIKKAAVQ